MANVLAKGKKADTILQMNYGEKFHMSLKFETEWRKKNK